MTFMIKDSQMIKRAIFDRKSLNFSVPGLLETRFAYAEMKFEKESVRVGDLCHALFTFFWCVLDIVEVCEL